MRLPESFQKRYRPIAPDGFFDALERGLPKTIRVNTLKTPVEAFRERAARRGWELSPLPWLAEGFLIDREDRSDPLGHSLEHFAGQFYIQEASSMIPPTVLGARPGERVLDMAAAPGSKTTQLAAMMENRGLLVANDNSIPRIKALTANLERVGVLNVVLTQLAGARLGRFVPGYFDRVLLDAPCTAEGTIAKSPEALIRWSETAIRKLSVIQSKLLVGAYGALRPGGTLVYSTCTFAPEENEGVLSGFLQHHPEATVEPFDLPGLRLAPGIAEWQGERFHSGVTNSRRVWPGTEAMEGFFIARIRKGEGEPAAPGRPFADRRYGEPDAAAAEWLAERFGVTDLPAEPVVRSKDEERWAMTPEANAFDGLPTVRRGLRIARTVRGGYKPTTDWVQLMGERITENRIETDGTATRRYLAGQDIPHDGPERGYVALVHDGLTYACGLAQEGKIKNQLPVSRRIIGR